jgi:uncharacterized caspase-like protein
MTTQLFALMKIVKHLFPWMLLLALLGGVACTTVQELEQAKAAESRRDYSQALALYRKTQTGNFPVEAKAQAKQAEDALRRNRVDEALRQGNAALAGGDSIAALEAKIKALEGFREFEDSANRLAREIQATRQAVNAKREALVARESEYNSALAAGRWTEALNAASQALAIDSTQEKYRRWAEDALNQRNDFFTRSVANALSRKDISGARALRARYAAESPAPPQSDLLRIDADILESVEDGIPLRLDELISQKRFYEAHNLLQTSVRPKTLRDYAHISKTGADFYREIALAARREARPPLGPAYFAAYAAYLLDPNNPENFRVRRDYTDDISKEVQSKVAVATFGSPSTQPDEGATFTENIFTTFAENLPYGISLLERNLVDQALSQKDTDREYFMNRNNVERLIRGNVLELRIESSSRPSRRTISYRAGEIRERNREYDEALMRAGNNPSKVPAHIPQFVSRPDMREHTYDVYNELMSGVMQASVSISDARSNVILVTRRFDSMEEVRDTYHDAVPIANIPAKPSIMPSELQMKRTLREKLVSDILGVIIQSFENREERFLTAHREAMQRREIDAAFRELARAYEYYRGELSRTNKQPDAKLKGMFERALVELADELATFHRTPIVVGATGAGRPSSTAAAPVVQERGGRHFAIIVGVSNYSDRSIPSLRYAAKDAREFYNYLVDPQGGGVLADNIKLLLDHEATTRNIRRTINSVLRQTQEDDMVTFFFAGHGSPDSPERPDLLFLLAHDSEFADVASTSYPMSEINDALTTYAKARRIMIVADACHSGGIGAKFEIGRRSLAPVRFSADQMEQLFAAKEEPAAVATPGTPPPIRRSLAFISASGPEETSQEGPQWGGGHGVFTYTLLRGMRGAADMDGDGQITLGELLPWVRAEVARATENAQNPTTAGSPDFSLVVGRALR